MHSVVPKLRTNATGANMKAVHVLGSGSGGSVTVLGSAKASGHGCWTVHAKAGCDEVGKGIGDNELQFTACITLVCHVG